MNQMQIDVIKYIQENPETKQSDLAEMFDISIGSVNKYFREKDMDLSKYEVKNAVLFAAGWGSRMSPITDRTPKPLVKVKGQPFIESIIERLKETEIHNIHIVVGKYREQFEYLVDKYDVKLIHNPDWSTRNNISSLYFSQKIVGNTLYFECDQILAKDILRTHYAGSCFHGTWRNETNIEDRFYLNGKQVINIKKSTEPGYYWNGIVFVSAKDQKLLLDYCNAVYKKPGYVDSLWEKLLLELINNNKMKMSLSELQEGDALEIDTVEEIAAYDETYKDIWNQVKREREIAVKKINE